MNEIFSLRGKKVLVTGASSGIGRSIAINCSKMGANISISARSKERLKETIDLMSGEDHYFQTADLNNEEEIIALVKQLPELDGVVLNAGIVKITPVKYIKSDVLSNIFNVNVFSSMLIIKQLLKQKKINNNCSICFISSVSSKKSTVSYAMYGATKAAINSFTKSLALELAPKKVRVNAILPGLVETNIINDRSVIKDNLNNHLKDYPIGRFGKPEDVAYLAIYLLSDASSWMTGSLLTIDGGLTLK